jgi:hypothetical protein
VFSEDTASIFRAQMSQIMRVARYIEKNSVSITYILKMNAASSSETLVSTYEMEWCHKPEEEIYNCEVLTFVVMKNSKGKM